MKIKLLCFSHFSICIVQIPVNDVHVLSMLTKCIFEGSFNHFQHFHRHVSLEFCNLKYYSCFKFVREMAFVYSRFAFEVNDLDCKGDVLYNLGQVFQKLVNVNPGLNVN